MYNKPSEIRRLNRRIRLLKALGLQQGTVYEKHREKIQNSYGYIRDGNLRHYALCRPKKRRKPTSDNL